MSTVESLLIAWTGEALEVIDYDTGTVLHPLEGSDVVGWPVISPDGRRVAAITNTQSTIDIWDVHTGKRLHSIAGHGSQTYVASFSPDSRSIVTASADFVAIVSDVETGKTILRVEDIGGFPSTARFNPASDRLAIATATGGVSVWDLSTQEQVGGFKGHFSRVGNAEFSPDGRRMLSTDHNSIRIWDPALMDAPELLRLGGHSRLIYATWLPDGSGIVSCWRDGSVIIYDYDADDLAAAGEPGERLEAPLDPPGDEDEWR